MYSTNDHITWQRTGGKISFLWLEFWAIKKRRKPKTFHWHSMAFLRRAHRAAAGTTFTDGNHWESRTNTRANGRWARERMAIARSGEFSLQIMRFVFLPKMWFMPSLCSFFQEEHFIISFYSEKLRSYQKETFWSFRVRLLDWVRLFSYLSPHLPEYLYTVTEEVWCLTGEVERGS